MLSLGIVGLPNVGKSTLFNAITRAGAEASNYPFCTIDPNVGIVEVPDERLNFLTGMHHSAKTIPAAIQITDIAGLVKGASKGEGLGNKFLANIREVDAILHVVRCFENENITHVSGKIDPVEDIEVIELELIYADLATAEKMVENSRKKAKSGNPQESAKVALFELIVDTLSAGRPVRSLELDDKQKELKKEIQFLTEKKVLYVANIAEEKISDPETDSNYQKILKIAARDDSLVIPISSRIESELAELPESEARELLNDYGLETSGLDLLAREGYKLLNLITFLTSGEKETRAWTIKQGTRAPQAAGVIHTDFEKGFIKAEVISYDLLKGLSGLQEAKEKGLVRQEGKEYIVQDGDVIVFKFNN